MMRRQATDTTPELSANAVQVLERRYLKRDREGRIRETPPEMFRRVARTVAAAERRYGGAAARARWQEEFSRAMSSLEFLPNSPTLMNAGTGAGHGENGQ